MVWFSRCLYCIRFIILTQINAGMITPPLQSIKTTKRNLASFEEPGIHKLTLTILPVYLMFFTLWDNILGTPFLNGKYLAISCKKYNQIHLDLNSASVAAGTEKCNKNAAFKTNVIQYL